VSETSAELLPRLKGKYLQEVVPALMEQFGYKNSMQVPRLEKIVINVGVGEGAQQPKLIDSTVEEIAMITGQRPIVTRARKSVASFRIRKGMPVGVKVTLRGNRMYYFLDKLFHLALPRVRDFRGVNPRGFDGRGNYTLGLKEQLVFPEIDYDKVQKIRGMEITIITSAKSDEEAFALLKELGMPFARG